VRSLLCAKPGAPRSGAPSGRRDLCAGTRQGQAREEEEKDPMVQINQAFNAASLQIESGAAPGWVAARPALADLFRDAKNEAMARFVEMQ